VARIINGIGEVKRSVPDMVISASGPSYLRQYSDLFAAGAIEEGLCDHILFGRMSFANPGFPKQVMELGRIDAKKTCVTCGKCGDLIRAGKPTGCVVREPEVYLKYYREYQESIK
jgi:2,4-dienoyl-CoA reductase-like NADH-dependent reductase (Old Yellow Enzyme family)